jgi:MerR family transcriptional regulator, light-induced transcriptional regulator
MRTLKTSEAAALLNVSPNTLRAWERRFGYPQPQRSPGKHRLYSFAEINALRDALEEGLSISSAVSVARDAFGADGQALLSALLAFRADRADEVLDRSLALRSVERSVEGVLLPALTVLGRRKGVTSAAWAFAVAWTDDWLVRARRLARVASRHGSVLIGDASVPPLDPTRPFVLALELCCVRSGLETLLLPVGAQSRLWEAVEAIRPDAVVIAGCHAADDDVARWAYKVRTQSGPLPFLLYHRGVNGFGVGGRTRVLPGSPVRAEAELLDLVASRSDNGKRGLPPSASGARTTLPTGATGLVE